MLDQYGNYVGDLFCIGHIRYSLPEDDMLLKIITDADWYEVEIDQSCGEEPPTTYLMVEYLRICSVLPNEDYNPFVYADGTVGEDLGGVLVSVTKVNDVLKCWSEEDGFYHA